MRYQRSLVSVYVPLPIRSLPTARRRRPNARRLTDAELVDRMRRRDAAAVQEFFERFHSLLMRESARLRVPSFMRDDVVTECLGETAIALMCQTRPAPRALGAYLLVALRRFVSNARRAERRRNSLHRAAVHEGAGRGEWIVPESASEDAMRASAGSDAAYRTLDPVLERLAAVLQKELGEDEERLLLWIGHWVPQRVIASWLGISYGAVRSRVQRLRVRLMSRAEQYAAALPDEERRVLRRFLGWKPPLRGSVSSHTHSEYEDA